MKKQQLILVGSGLVCLLLIYRFGRTVPSAKPTPQTAQVADNHPATVEFSTILQAAKQKLTPEQQLYVNGLESSVVRGDVQAQQIKVFSQLAAFWRDTVGYFAPYAYYTGAAAKLENSEKSLTFAAHQFLNELKGATQPMLKTWMADEAKQLFERALKVNPESDSSKIGLGSCYIFGSTAEHPEEVMAGIQKILEVARRDSTNMYAQLMLGIGGVVSGQLDKAVERLNKVVQFDPHNLEAIFMLAEAYEKKVDNKNAVRWYTVGRNHVRDSGIVKEIDAKINSLQ
ncbi:MAG: hypothetical protein H7Y27_07980 [Gemmatimonadaceae bacterium]|nr:hypothetical protein [Chitinophagaceae bacterium]